MPGIFARAIRAISRKFGEQLSDLARSQNLNRSFSQVIHSQGKSLTKGAYKKHLTMYVM